MFQIAERAYEFRGGLDPNLPGTADVTSPNGRADIRIQIDDDGELYILSKSDGMIRAIVGTASAVEGDYNRDGRVDVADYIVWRKSIGQNVAALSGADGSGNGTIDDADYDFWRARFGNSFGSGEGAQLDSSVPEAGSALLLLLGALSIWVTVDRRR
jgi:hypothetical protein